jgi:hypothetical protein
VANAVRYPAFAGFDPNDFFKPTHVNTDNKDFGPAFGLAWSPSFQAGPLRKLFGENKTVWRGGYQISYDAPFSQIVSLMLASAEPNAAVSVDNPAPSAGRGSPNYFGVSMGSLECLEPSAIHSDTQSEPAISAAWAVLESRFHRQQHPQHVGADQDDFLIIKPTGTLGIGERVGPVTSMEGSHSGRLTQDVTSHSGEVSLAKSKTR